MAPTSRVIQYVDRGAGGPITDCATDPYKVGEDMAFPLFKRDCLRQILGADDAHVLTGADGGKLIRWFLDNTSDDKHHFAVAFERGWVALKLLGAKIGDVPEHDPSKPIDPAFDDPPDWAKGLGFVAKALSNPLALIAIMAGFPLIAFGMYKGLQ